MSGPLPTLGGDGPGQAPKFLRLMESPLPTSRSYSYPLRIKGELQPAFQVTFVHFRSMESPILFPKLLPALGIWRNLDIGPQFTFLPCENDSAGPPSLPVTTLWGA